MGRNEEAVKVVVRCRPLNSTERADGRDTIVQMDAKMGSVSVHAPGSSEPPKAFTFDMVFDERSQQADLYQKTAMPIVDSVLDGFNGTIFAYGQTGTGKTFSMEGVNEPPELRGIIPRAFTQIFDRISSRAGDSTEFLSTGVYVKDLTSYVVRSVRECDKLRHFGAENRHVGATKMNADSSRSHSIYTITVEQCETDARGEAHIRQGKLNLVDLAGSERQAKTEASGERLKEATKINLSLSALGNCISALVDGKSKHVPFRDSKLTRLLQDSLGGNTKTVMVANMGPADWNYDETISTLRYANRAKNIKNKPKINEDPKDAMLREHRLKELEGKLIVGGENLLDKSEKQESPSHPPAVVELEQYASLEAEVEGKTRKLKRLWTKYQAAQADILDVQKEFQREKEDLLDTIRELSRQLKLRQLLMSASIPIEQLSKIERCSEWDDANEQWRISRLHFAGNPAVKAMSSVYFSYSNPAPSPEYDGRWHTVTQACEKNKLKTLTTN
ncbi:hypothetical protein EMIHUDRAFT_230328 [Emiliania huxleyi CCMP1516]|uniref:Kinesin-like protein n=2 Tax=Emiliania huxleyi TaxID=2903 RepID=A0A0D3KAH1_EMIH1|nr:hypothetical protein EMIHUDRAFT_230939 [Emiliania huxleyi CCMP1516]XP_005785185.1 hypothetical protein EMIHUDRAFT_230328 [Emiliania huxleyi CCMP1516]EOD32389.1 hypothetical protein EMIHUDRAFT_230939 [Emiliania huxleyi CCMP1516]EOD32756.1 hypothetical protein EMIHUDRAFT_230328 [Emiliania huxleyi CCMP1516]|eukprot:XP_005784818.1 hypothetical protein EMIHUDRAFT_230939 [Emiliania huxleyi CCMP1516]